MELQARTEHRQFQALLKALLSTAIAIPLAYLAHVILPHANLSLVFLTAVLLSASRFGMLTALYTAVLSFLSFKFFFSAPYYSLRVENDGDLATLLFFLVVAVVSGKLAARMQQEAAENRAMVKRLTNINELSRLLAAAPDSETIVQHLSRHIATTFDTPAWVVLSAPTTSHYGHDGKHPLPPLPQATQQRLMQQQSDGPLEEGYQLALNDSHGVSGRIYLKGKGPDPARHELLRILGDLAAVTLERTQLVGDLEQARLNSENEQLRSALLSSLSHDLRTPLSSIIGASSSLIEYSDTLPRSACKELLQTVLSEAERLNRYIQNLLDMTRLGGGTLKPKRDWSDIGDIIAAACERLRRELVPYNLVLQLPETPPLLHVQAVLIEQALVNVLDNATRFSQPGDTLTIQVEASAEQTLINVCDEGPGIPTAERERVFDMFYSVSRGDRHSQGTGLGLAICRGLLNAHGGEASAHPGLNGKGTCIRLSLPLAQPEPER
ncbi:MAG: sensor histidine kinase [Pseudomonadota bacterium]